MNRCLLIPAFLARAGAAALLAACAWGIAFAQDTVRQFPQGVRAGTLVVTAPPVVTIDGTALRLSPGARIQGPDNMQISSAALVGRPFLVYFLRDGLGQVTRVWILNQTEQDVVRAELLPTVNFTFGSSAPAPKVDDGKTPYDQLPKYKATP